MTKMKVSCFRKERRLMNKMRSAVENTDSGNFKSDVK